MIRRLVPFQLFGPSPGTRLAYVGTALALLLTLAATGCGGAYRQVAPAPQSLNDALGHFLAAVKANDLRRMGALWGTARGPAAQWMREPELTQRLTVIQRYLTHAGHRVIEGPLAPPSGADNVRTFRVELQRERCSTVIPIDLVRTRQGGWLVYDVHLESAGNPAAPCPPSGPGTGP